MMLDHTLEKTLFHRNFSRWMISVGSLDPESHAGCGITYESRSGLIAVLHRLGVEHRKPKAESSKLHPDKQAAIIKSYENLLSHIGDDGAVLFGDAVHPTHAERPVQCWVPKNTPLAVPQRNGPQRLNIHSAIDLDTGKTRMIAEATANANSVPRADRGIMFAAGARGDISRQALDPSGCEQFLILPRQAGAGLADAPGVPDPAELHPRLLLPVSGSDRAPAGPDARACHPQPMSCDIRRNQSGDSYCNPVTDNFPGRDDLSGVIARVDSEDSVENFVACFPKSGSIYFSDLIGNLPGFSPVLSIRPEDGGDRTTHGDVTYVGSFAPSQVFGVGSMPGAIVAPIMPHHPLLKRS
jgi:hypothetical protein